ncbi:hypothetical protein O2N63_11620 [Aliiroseovarius sp. KMU-50]|uniref:Uncharacterized protein n=1 Tax=Aliiroseovarius salicola TaxID=3009082 RepID=A0ABT4W2J8_9RHOB|nr:hypothetical protein [Aliiroseovarius sp. KMU-50]MDA5094732.1 hypothetical protein [Aliiroseovarius sp. KMU-50]
MEEAQEMQSNEQTPVFCQKHTKTHEVNRYQSVQNLGKWLFSCLMPQPRLGDFTTERSPEQKPHLQCDFADAPLFSFSSSFIQKHQEIANNTDATEPDDDEQRNIQSATPKK